MSMSGRMRRMGRSGRMRKMGRSGQTRGMSAGIRGSCQAARAEHRRWGGKERQRRMGP